MEKHCCACGGRLSHFSRDKIQLGQAGFFTGIWSNILAGSLEVDVYCCVSCGKIEFFHPLEVELDSQQQGARGKIVGTSRDGVPQVICPNCGKQIDFDYPRCPMCGKTNA